MDVADYPLVSSNKGTTPAVAASVWGYLGKRIRTRRSSNNSPGTALKTVDRFSRFIPDGYNIGLVSTYDEAETLIVQHDFMHLSFYKDDFKEFVDTLVVALRGMEQTENPVAHIHPVLVHEGVTPTAEVDAHDSR